MNLKSNKLWLLAASLGLIVSTVMCSPSVDEATPTPTSTPTAEAPELVASPTPTPTPTPQPLPAGPNPTATPCPCDGVSGAIEVQVLVGPAAAVGLEPVAVGSVPFVVVCGTVQGEGPVAYEAVLTENWGTYEVTLDLDISISGECTEDAGLNVTLDLAGNQFVEVTSEGFHGEYPWEGEQSFNLTFPLEDGATVQGEGWAFVLHLN